MNPNLPPCFGSIPSLFRHPLALLGGVLLCLAQAAALGQSVTFAGAQTTLPTSGLSYPIGVAVDSAGDVFIADPNNFRVLELSKTATGYGPQTTLPFSSLDSPYGVAVDGAGDVFVADSVNNRVLELPKTATGYGPQETLPTSGLSSPLGVAVDSAGDVFIADPNNFRVLELSKTATGYGPQTTLPFPFSSLVSPHGVAVDGAGDVFVADSVTLRVVELPKTSTGYGPPTTLPFSGLSQPFGVAVDSAGDVFVADTGNSRVVELPKTSTGYGPQTTLPFSGLHYPYGVAADSAGDVFVSDRVNQREVELQTISVNFEGVNVCAPGATTPAPCNETLTLNYTVTTSGTLDTPQVLTGGAPNLDFTLASGSTCSGAVSAGSTCVVNVMFAPKFVGTRSGSVEITDGSGNVLAYVPVYGTGNGPQVIGTALTSSANPSTLGEAVTFAATVTAASGPTPTGTVGFYDASGANLLATAALNDGVATYTTSSLPVGTYHIVAKYSGSGADPASESAVLVQKVLYGTTTTLTSSANPATAGETVAFTATVTPSGGATPTGTVRFYDAYGATLLATAALTDGVATYTRSSLPVGTYHIVAEYSGSGSDAVSDSALLVQVVGD